MLQGRKLELSINLRSGRKVNILRPALFKEKTYKVDVRNFLTNNDYVLKKIVQDNSLSVKSGRKVHMDETMQNCWEWLKDNVTYTRDEVNGVKTDFWTMPALTAQNHEGDCENFATLLVSLAMCAGIPYYRLQVALGHVGKNEKAPSGAHAYVLYLCEEGKWQIWEGTSKKKGLKGYANELIGNSWYIDIYNTFNLKYCFKHKSITDYI